jgi:hypothetical protein
VVDNVTHFRVEEYIRRGEEGRFARVVSLGRRSKGVEMID